MIDLPTWINPESWAGFVEMRKSMGKGIPFTDRAASLIILQLGRLQLQGYDPNLCLDRSVMNGWRGVFPHDSCKIARNATRDAATQAIFDNMDQAIRDSQTPEARAKVAEIRQKFGLRRVS
jgi:hypothetical protein